ncbi:branched-subunit amino acid ABC-type transport system permease component [Rhizobium aquaticum]|uniref:Branched-subunit amino acid ABC-type transport system permease component n=1 Tax=Rhizobium aquaticum TaxID=1549636 RepID=A0ABV2J682_9HYPH
MDSTAIILAIVSGLALGSIYTLVATSFTLVIAASGVFNFAQGTLVMLGTIATYIVGQVYGFSALSTAALVTLIGLALGLVTYIVAVLPVATRAHSLTHVTLLTTIGLGTASNGATAAFFGGDSRFVPSFVTDNPILLAGMPLRPIYLVEALCGLLIVAAIQIAMRRTMLGHVFRTTLEDPEGAGLFGIDTRKVVAITFSLAGAVSMLAGFLVAPIVAASVNSANDLAFFGFAGMAIGGFGSFGGTVIGSLVVGLIVGLSPLVGGPNAPVPSVWIAVVLVLLVRPSGLAGSMGLFGAQGAREI